MGRLLPGAIALALLLAGCRSPAAARVMRAVDAVGGIERLRAVQQYDTTTRIVGTGRYSVSNGPEGLFEARSLGRETFRRSGSFHTGETYGVHPVDIAHSAGGEWLRSLDAGTTWSALDHVESVQWALRGRVDPSILLPDLLLADDVELEATEPVVVDGTAHPAVSVTFAGLPTVTYVFDPDTGRLDRALLPALPGVKDADAVIVLGDWRDAGGVWVAHERRDPRPGLDKRRETVVALDLHEAETDDDFVTRAATKALSTVTVEGEVGLR